MTLKMVTPSVYVNDDEIAFKQIVVLLANSQRVRKYTIDAAEKRGLVKVKSVSEKFERTQYSKSIAILNHRVKLLLTTKMY
jgi:hypothetical protein